MHVARNSDQAWDEAAPHLHYMMTLYDQWLAPGEEGWLEGMERRDGKAAQPA